MALVYQQNINGSCKLGVWQLSEPEDFFLKKVPLQNKISHPHKRLQHLGGRYLLTQLYPDFPLELIEIADTRKPFLPNEDYHFSISHCGDYAAVIASPESRVGIDIENVSEKVMRLQDKFLSQREKELIANYCSVEEPGLNMVQLVTAFWSIKETLFKWHSLGGLDFRQQLNVNNFYLAGGELTVDCVVRLDAEIELPVKGIFLEDTVLTWAVT